MANSVPDVFGQAPRFAARDASRVAREVFGVRAAAGRLPSERDQNFHLTATSGEQYVLKVSNAVERREVLELQNRAMEHVAALAGEDFENPCPRVCASAGGEALTTVTSPEGTTHFVRLLTFLPGRPLARVRPRDLQLLRSLGRFLGRLDDALASFDDPAASREFHWDLQHAGRTIRGCLASIAGEEARSLVLGFLQLFETSLAPVADELARGIIHSDGNDHNLLVRQVAPWRLEVAGVIDFGDMIHSFRVCEPAIAAAYAALGQSDPLAAAAHVVAGYHQIRPLTEAELEVLFPLICARLAVSVSLSARQQKLAPDNEYLGISEQPAWSALRRLSQIHPRLANYVLRQACGLAPCARGRRLARWLQQHRSRFDPVIDAPLESPGARVLDLSVGGTDAGAVTPGDTASLAARIEQRLQTAGAHVGIGRYNEPRLLYDAPQFATAGAAPPRTIHLGVDLFVPAGTEIRSPADGRIHSFANNTARLDYGPTIIVEHSADGDGTFFILYGHLDRTSLDGLQVGLPIGRGQRIGTVGAPPENGDWPPHLHLQLIADLFDEVGNFPGVACAEQRETWLSICPDPALILGVPATELSLPALDTPAILEARRQHVGPSLSTSYREPLQVVRGIGAHLYDENGRSYLDGVNNVCHVGHCHPRVVGAAQQQIERLNTNTRYLHPARARYARRLAGTLPSPLEVCYLVCSGSEANELALRLAWAHSGRQDVIAIAGGYHGHTRTLIDVSAYKHAGPGGNGPPPWVHTVALPDGYRGPHRGRNEATASCYVEEVQVLVERLVDDGRAPAAFICESLPGCGGQIVPPPGYLRRAFEHIRAGGGVCIADEVQVGFGRVGSHFWAFEAQQAVPDIVTLGKPIGNGHPLAAVVTTREIADAFDNGMEYFNTFGGNPVSCVVGEAVLDVIEDEGLQENALEVGRFLLDGLRGLQQRHLLIGDVRGLGLFIGVELVKDRKTREPAPEHAAHVVERMKQHRILLSADGLDRNVIKIKPPLVITREHATQLVETLNRVLQEDLLQV